MESIIESGLDAFLFLSSSDIRYLTGNIAEHSAVIGTNKELILISEHLSNNTKRRSRNISLVDAQGPYFTEICKTLLRLKVRRIGFDGHVTKHFQYEIMKRLLPGRQVTPSLNPLLSMRMKKEKQEICVIMESIRLAERGLLKALDHFDPKYSEQEFGFIVDCFVRHASLMQKTFDSIVLSDINTHIPHGVPSSRKKLKGSWFMVDFGACCSGYHSDCTRLIFHRKPNSRQNKILNVVLAALDLAISSIHPGVKISSVAQKVRSLIDNAGLAQYYNRNLGHGVGLDLHEPPFFNDESEFLIEEGMVIAIEPGIFVPGWGGMKIEEMIYVDSDENKILTNLPRQIHI